MSWTSDRLLEFTDMLSEWPVAISVGSTISTCIKTPDKIEKRIVNPQGPYISIRISTFDMFKTAFNSLGLGDRKQFTCEGRTWEINLVVDESTDPVMQFRAETRV